MRRFRDPPTRSGNRILIAVNTNEPRRIDAAVVYTDNVENI